jgi:tetratricopeptide (TPR) repeat protein
LDEAVALYRLMIEAEPSNYSYREKLAGLYLENAQVTEAADEFRSIAMAHLEEGRKDTARIYVDKAAELDAEGPSQDRLECLMAEATGDIAKIGECQERLAKSELEAGRPELALEALQRASEAGRPGVVEVLAKTLMALKKYPEARVAFQKLLDERPGDETVLENLLTLDEQAKDWSSALTRVNALLAAHPENVAFLQRAAKANMQLGKSPDAAQLYMRLAGQAFKEGHYESVMSAFNAILAFQPDNAEALKKKAELLFKMGKKAETIAAYKELEKLLARKAPEEARKVAMLVSRIQSLPDHPSRNTLH